MSVVIRTEVVVTIVLIRQRLTCANVHLDLLCLMTHCHAKVNLFNFLINKFIMFNF